MTLLFSSVVLALAWFAAVNAAVSAVAWVVGRAIANNPRPRPAGLLLAVRAAPSTASMLFVMAVFLPAHWRYELPGTQESFGAVLYGLAVLSLVILLRSVSRVLLAVRVNREIRRSGRGRPVDGIADAIEVDGLAGLSLVGFWRTRILLGSQVRGALTATELEAALAHEVAHRRAWDNVKRFAMFCAPDFFGRSQACRDLEARWSEETECVADARAVGGDSRRAVDLASALVKVARLAGRPPALPAASLWNGFCDEPLIERRVRQLVDGSIDRIAHDTHASVFAGALTITGVVLAFVALPGVYRLTEDLVRLLP